MRYLQCEVLMVFHLLQAHLYEQIEAAGITYISVGHRRTLYDFHKRVLRISTVDQNSSQSNWKLEFIDQESLYNLSRR